MSAGSLRLRLIVVGLASIAAALAASAVGLVVLFERHVERRIDDELRVYLNQLVTGIDRNAAGEITVVNGPADPRFDRPLSGLYWQVIVAPNDSILRSRSLWDMELAMPKDAPDVGAIRQYRLPGPARATLYIVERRFELPERFFGITIRAAAGIDTAEIRRAVKGFLRDLVPFLVVIGTLLMAAAWAQVAVGLRPLATIQQRLASIRSGKTQRLGEGFPQEVRPLANEIDALLDARDRQIGKARARSGDLAHALKTPLQVLAGEAERLGGKRESELAAQVNSLVEVMRRLVDRELTRTRLAAGAGNASANLLEVAQGVVNVVRLTPDGERLSWSVSIPAGLKARIDAVELAEALGNLLENAARHAVSGVDVSGRCEGEHAFITVADDGPGIPADKLPEALRRGGRLDVAASGSGLGLAIVNDIAEAAEASLEIENGEPGLRASLRFRRA